MTSNFFKEYNFEFQGYPDYQDVLPELERIIQTKAKGAFPLILALNEAVCNAAKYSTSGPLNAKIFINLKIICHNIIITISAKTIKFNALNYQKKLQKIASDKTAANKTWTDYVGIEPVSRGFWLMLSAVDYLIIKDDGNKVKLVFNTRSNIKQSKKVGDLVQKFIVEKDGVYL